MGWCAFTFKYIKSAENIHTTNLGLFLAYPYVWYWIITWLHLVCSSTDVQHQYLTSPPGWLQSFKQGRRSPLHSYYGDVASVSGWGNGEGNLYNTASMEMVALVSRWQKRLHPNLTGNLSSTCRDQIQWQFWWPQMTYLSSASDDFCLASWARLPSVM